VTKLVHHVVTRPGRLHGDPDVEIPVAEDLVTVPGNPEREEDLAFYSREYPLESQNVDNAADREWGWSVYTPDIYAYAKNFQETNKPLALEAAATGDLPPTGEPDPSVDFTASVREKARELGFGEVGFTHYDRRYTFASKKPWAKFSNVICLAVEQDYDVTQTIPSLEAEVEHFDTYAYGAGLEMELGDHIRSLGYRAQVHSPLDNSGMHIPLFINAGLGQLGANGQLLSPHFGSRARLMVITTDGPLVHDEPVDYGINKFCEQCQVCVERCPARALVREKVWWRGAKKNKLVYDRCRPIMTIYEGCGVCMKVCPVQRYGMKEVMEHYVATGKVMGKGTDDLEGYDIGDKGHFGPGELPTFDREDFEFPRGSKDEALLQQFRNKVAEAGELTPEDREDFANRMAELLEAGPATTSDMDVGPAV
jgi:ferredoxin